MKRTLSISLFSLMITLFVFANLGAQEPIKKLTLDLYLDMESVSNPQISPDGKQIIYTRRWVDKMNDSRKSSLWIMNVDGFKNRFLVEGSSAQWSPDGSRIAFTASGKPKGSQIHVRWMDAEGAVTQITRVEQSPSNIRWSPNGKTIAFSMLVPEKDKWTVKLPAKPEGAKWTKEPRIIDRLRYRRDRRGFIKEGFNHVFIVPADGGTPRQITSGDFSHSSPRWTPDGSEIICSSLRVDDAEYQWRESEIYAVNVKTGETKQLTTRKGPDGNPVPSPNGKYIAYTGYDFTDDTYITNKIYVMNRDGSNPHKISGDFDRRSSGLTWASDNSGVYFNTRSEGSRNVYFASLKNGVKPITEGTHYISVSSINKNGKAAAVWADSHNPGDVIAFDLKKPKQITQLTHVNEDILSDVKLGEVEEIWYNSVDDFKIQGWIVKPPDFDPNRKYPLILAIHGGPHGMYGVGFNFAWQNHAAEDFVVLYTNPRGSDGYGSPFGNAIKNAYPDKDFDDLMKGVDEVIAKGYIDERNLFVYGGSGGGVLTAWIVGHTDRFAAASSNYPVIDWISFVGTTDGASWYRNFKKFPWEDPSEHLKRSPLMYAGNVKTPTMLMTGIKDLRTPISQTEEFYMALKVQKIPTVMLRFNEEWHGTSSKPSNFMRSVLYLRSWFDKYKTKDEIAGR